VIELRLDEARCRGDGVDGDAGVDAQPVQHVEQIFGGQVAPAELSNVVTP
jgi:hypothetical protein